MKYRLSDISTYVKEKVKVDKLDENTYIRPYFRKIWQATNDGGFHTERAISLLQKAGVLR